MHGYHVFPDAHAAGAGEQPQWLYSVRFPARELWGDQANAADHVHADLWESYFERH
ncbi:MAG: nitrile hydratase subunit beta [Fimbriimonadaceae bacterium]|nr:nitrile hydratase subunit beta [Alphaproteobacteria bacterium]